MCNGNWPRGDRGAVAQAIGHEGTGMRCAWSCWPARGAFLLSATHCEACHAHPAAKRNASSYFARTFRSAGRPDLPAGQAVLLAGGPWAGGAVLQGVQPDLTHLPRHAEVSGARCRPSMCFVICTVAQEGRGALPCPARTPYARRSLFRQAPVAPRVRLLHS